jgi:LacI family transcriptional regulator
MRGTTLKDIARRAGTAPSTVSRALNGLPGVGEATRARILRLVRRCHYVPNPMARSLVGKPSTILDVIVPRSAAYALTHPAYGELLRGAGIEADRRGYHLLLSFAPAAYGERVEQGIAGGVLVVFNRTDDPGIAALLGQRVPLVALPGVAHRTDLPAVRSDDVEAGRMAGRHLVELGHRRIGMIVGPRNSRYGADRLAGLQSALREAGLTLERRLTRASDFTCEEGYRAARSLIAEPEPPTAIVCVDDPTAVGACWGCLAAGLRIPQDVSLVGFGGTKEATLTTPPLTTVSIDYPELGRRAIDLLVRLVEGRAVSAPPPLPVRLDVRGSTAPPHAVRWSRRRARPDARSLARPVTRGA